MLKTGDKAPDISLSDKDGKTFTLSSLYGKKNIVLYFYPKNFTPGCTKEACSFRDAYEDFLEAGAEVIGVSADTVASHAKFASGRDLPFILLSDPKFEAHKAYNVKPSLFGILRARATYVIDKEGTIRNAFESQLNIGKHIQEALAVVKELS